MGKGLTPDWQLHSVFDIDLEQLRAMGRTSLIFDLDNTLTGWNSYTISPETKEWVRSLKEQSFQALILSNNHRERIAAIAGCLEIPFVERAGKPRKRGYLQAAARLGVTPEKAVMVGDQIFTDVFGANRAGLFTILVDPLEKREYWGTKISRFFERNVMRRRPVSSSQPGTLPGRKQT